MANVKGKEIKEGMAAMLEEQESGVVQITLNRKEKATKPADGADETGNPLPAASLYRVESPARNYNGTTAGVIFQNGKGATNDRELAWLLVHDYGYKASVEQHPELVAQTEVRLPVAPGS